MKNFILPSLILITFSSTCGMNPAKKTLVLADIDPLIIDRIVDVSKISEEAAATYKSLYRLNHHFRNLITQRTPLIIASFAQKFTDRSELDAAKCINTGWAREWRDSVWAKVGPIVPVRNKRKSVKRCFREASFHIDGKLVKYLDPEEAAYHLSRDAHARHYLQDPRIMIWMLREMAQHTIRSPQELMQALSQNEINEIEHSTVVAWLAKAQKEYELNQAIKAKNKEKVSEYFACGC